MSAKTARQQKIVEIIQHQHISRQEDLIDQLSKHGFSVTQATLSRDLKELQVGKIPHHQFGSVYFVGVHNEHLRELHGLKSIEWVRGMVLVKCLPGFANSVAALLDESPIESIAGTIAGNDTVLVVIKDDADFEQFTAELQHQFNGLDYLF